VDEVDAPRCADRQVNPQVFIGHPELSGPVSIPMGGGGRRSRLPGGVLAPRIPYDPEVVHTELVVGARMAGRCEEDLDAVV